MWPMDVGMDSNESQPDGLPDGIRAALLYGGAFPWLAD